jgi:predicted metal-dependent peptidase
MNRQAQAKLDRALLNMASRYPMYAYLLSLRMFRADRHVPTVAVMHCDNQWTYRYNPDFILSISDDELCGVIHHEINHIEFGHVSADPDEMPDRRARIIAEEVTVNEYVNEPLPGLPLTLDQFPELPHGEDTWTRYKRLEGKSDPYQWVDELQIADPWRGPCASESERDDFGARGARLRERLRQSMDPAYLAARQMDLATFAPPTKPIPWNTLLRRFPQLVGIVPGTTVVGRPRVMAAVDTSGSMSSESLAQIGRELTRLAGYSEVTVVECDDEIRATYRLGGTLRGVRGRGSTDLRPPLSAQCIDQVRPDVVVYFTDGEGTAPDQQPPVPVIWALSPGGKPPANWGEIIQLE